MKSEVKGTATSKRLGNTATEGFEPPIAASERPQTHVLDRRPLRSAAMSIELLNSPIGLT